jgi:phospholipid/cholesterol/gamma-HCH transport system substrate-binding protein
MSALTRKAALFALGLALAAAALSSCTTGGYRVTATFDDVGDLQRAGSVQVADVRVGTITGIKLVRGAEGAYRAKVTMRIGGAHVPRNSRAIVRTTSLLGEKFVELRPLGKPDQGPFLRDGDTITDTSAAPELEFVAEQAIDVLGGVSGNDIAVLNETGATAFGGRAVELKGLLQDLSSISATLASRSNQLTTIIDNLDRATQTLSGGADQIRDLLTNLATTTQVLADNRQRAVDALGQLSRLAAVQNEVLDRYEADIDRQIKQVDGIVAVAATQTKAVGTLVDFLDKFVTGIPKAIPDEFVQVYMWAIPCPQDTRPHNPGGC